MSQVKFTSGPWHVGTNGNSLTVRHQSGTVARLAIAPDSVHAETGFANAHLIASAPDLLGELKRMVEHFGTFASDHSTDATTETWAALHCAKEIIAKAEGQR